MAEVRDYPAIALKYATDVCAGKIPAGLQIRLQCRRFLDELKLSKVRGSKFPYVFDEALAARPCRFIEKLPHSKGKWASKKERLVLQPWQIWIICLTFGWVHRAGERKGLRRFRRLFLVVPRKNGKSAIAAGLGLYMLCADGEFGAEVYSGATNEKQAWEVFKPARLMVERTPALKKHFGLEVPARAIVRIADGSKFETIIGDPGDGQSPSCSIHDEYHEHGDDGQVDTMMTGMGARDQPLQLLITTAGDNLAGPCYALIQEERKKLAGIGHNGGPPLDDETLFIEYTMDEDDDWKSDLALRKANPNADVSVSLDFLRARQRDAIATPRKAGVFKTKHLNLWVSAKAAYFDVEAWRKCADPEIPQNPRDALKLAWLRGRRAIIGLDLASKVDIAAVEVLVLPNGEKATVDDPYIRFGFYFLPEDTVAEVPHYQSWDSLGLLEVTPGNIVDYDEIEALIVEISEILQVEAVPYDPFQATQLSTRLAKAGVPVVEYRPTVLNFSEPMKELDALTRSRRIIHGGDPVMEWEISNVVGAPDKKDNVYPNKPEGQPHLKIDNPVALMSAIGVHMGEEKEEVPASPWDDPNYSMVPS
ncbi:phage terminase large subunit-like protein [Sphingobium wenxiniae]|uniref:Phage terminase large subunit-like protein n=1 Tax=Sphingobium wenxiniae (strain DSM 21828 / CGMCC 1.7748 / JZ-1) TaxID=595605 RepID=A0A562KLA1_SPHWJ|nr:terminase TerL endonuclease subunit [Sphingobium wenxiniae]MBB6191188.1 phage terminase large subunit-like protein [Sphingobium wenxiniae]TWH96013.1 phage terminase large subunit-like protein [Sphingobium wenxiniae]